jgi:hypothetical protein
MDWIMRSHQKNMNHKDFRGFVYMVPSLSRWITIWITKNIENLSFDPAKIAVIG